MLDDETPKTESVKTEKISTEKTDTESTSTEPTNIESISTKSTGTESVETGAQSPLIKTPNGTTMVSQDSKNMALLAWIGSIFFMFLAPLALMIVKKDDEFVQQHSKESINLSITMIIVYVVCMFTFFLVLPIFVMMIAGVANLVFCIIAAIKASNGEAYRVPVPILRLVK